MNIKILIVLVLFITASIFSYEEILIDFNNLSETMIDFSEAAGDAWTPEQKQAMKMDLNINNWQVKVNESSWTYKARDKSYTLSVNKSIAYPGQNVLGVRIYFPQRYANSYAEIKPPFTIPLFYEKDKNNPDGKGTMFLNKGVIRNVGVLREVKVRFLGNNFKYALYIRLENNRSEIRDIFIGYLDFVGWKSKTWRNPNIDTELEARQLNYNQKPYYPDEMPSVRILSFIIHRTHETTTGNFTTMIKEVSLEFDEAFLEVGKTEYKQEEIFGIYNEELMERALKETKDVDKKIYLEWMEKQKMHKEEKKEEKKDDKNK